MWKNAARPQCTKVEAASGAVSYEPRIPSAAPGYASLQQRPADLFEAIPDYSSVPQAVPTTVSSSQTASFDSLHEAYNSGLAFPAFSPRTRSHSAPEHGIRRYDSYESAYSLPEAPFNAIKPTTVAYESAGPLVDDSWLSTYLPEPPSQYSSRPRSSLGDASTFSSARGSFSGTGSLASSFVEVPMESDYDAQLVNSTLGQVLHGGSMN